MLRAIIIAFSTYSKIPTPRFTWEQEDMKYVMCAFPLVGAVVSLAEYLAHVMLTHFGIGFILSAAIMTSIPLLLTGGIHMDGYMDTWDALCSYGDKDKKLAILKDPHVGAFAVIHCITYTLLTFALWHELIRRIGEGEAEQVRLYMVLSGFILSRILSGIFAVTFRKAKREGMLYDITGRETDDEYKNDKHKDKKTESRDNKCRNILVSELIVFTVCIVWFFGFKAVFIIIPAGIVSGIYRHISCKHFEGITGDLAGWFLQLTELSFLFAVTLF